MKEPKYLLSRPNVTARALVEYKKKFLLLYAPWCKKWTLPGGRVECTDTLEQTISRELTEEIGIKPKKIKFVGFGQGAQYGESIKCAPPKLHMIFYTPINKKPVVNKKESEKTKWVTLEEMKKLKDKEDGIDDFFRRFPNAL